MQIDAVLKAYIPVLWMNVMKLLRGLKATGFYSS